MKNGGKYETIGMAWLYQLRHPSEITTYLIAAVSSKDARRIAAEIQNVKPSEVKGLRRVTHDTLFDWDFKRDGINVIRYKNSYLLPEHRPVATDAERPQTRPTRRKPRDT